MRAVPAGAGRWELLRALGAYTEAPGRALAEALGLETPVTAEHTRAFVLDLPPYASIHLGPEGQMGGEAHDRVGGLWRALSLDAPPDADHLASILGLVAELGVAAEGCRTDGARRRLTHARSVLVGEHLASWLPGYLVAARSYPAATAWVELARSALQHEVDELSIPEALPIALRDAPPAPARFEGADDLLATVLAPVRSGMVITFQDLEVGAATAGVGLRRGERRYALRAMLDQDPYATLAWLADHARAWADLHRTAGVQRTPSTWWSSRAAATASAIDELRRQPVRSGGGTSDPRRVDRVEESVR